MARSRKRNSKHVVSSSFSCDDRPAKPLLWEAKSFLESLEEEQKVIHEDLCPALVRVLLKDQCMACGNWDMEWLYALGIEESTQTVALCIKPAHLYLPFSEALLCDWEDWRWKWQYAELYELACSKRKRVDWLVRELFWCGNVAPKPINCIVNELLQNFATWFRYGLSLIHI